jgi:hypothetical protein
MSLIDRLKSLNPITAMDKAVRVAVEDKTHAAVAAVAQDVAKLSPELADLLSGEPIEIIITVRLKQKGES